MNRQHHRSWLAVGALAGCLTFTGSVTTASASPQGYGRQALREDQGRRFDDHDRQMARAWYDGHRGAWPMGLRDRDRLSSDLELRFEPGFTIDARLRRDVHPIPADLARRLSMPPRGMRYVFVDGHLCLIDARYNVVDVIHMGHGR